MAVKRTNKGRGAVVFRRIKRGGRTRIVPIRLKNGIGRTAQDRQLTIGSAKLLVGIGFAAIGGFEAGILAKKSRSNLFAGNTVLRNLGRKAGSPLRRVAKSAASRLVSSGRFTRSLSRRTLGLSIVAGTVGIKEGVDSIRRGLGTTERKNQQFFFEDLTAATILGAGITGSAFLAGSGRVKKKIILKGFKRVAKRLVK